MPTGRPPKYDNPEEMEAKIEEYFNGGSEKRIVFVGKDKDQQVEIPVLTITGLVLYLGFCDRSSFYKYEDKPEFRHTIKKARSKIEQEYEKLLQQGLGAGAIFALKNFGWVDKQEVDVNANIVTMDKITKDGEEIEFDVEAPEIT